MSVVTGRARLGAFNVAPRKIQRTSKKKWDGTGSWWQTVKEDGRGGHRRDYPRVGVTVR